MCSDCSIRTICTINEHTSVWKRWLGRWGSNALQTSQTAQRQSLLHGVSVKFSCLKRTNGRMCVWSPTSYASRLSKEWLQALLLLYTITWCSLPTPSCVEGRGGQVFFSLLPPMSLGGRLHEVILYVSVWIKSIHPCSMLNMHLQIIAQARQLHDTKLGSPVCITFCTPQKQLLSLYQRLAPLWPTTQQPVNPFLLVGSQ